MYDRILVPTDGSAGMGGVVRHAVELAAFHDAEIHGLYVVETGRYSTLPVKTGWENLTEMLREEGETALDDLREGRMDVGRLGDAFGVGAGRHGSARLVDEPFRRVTAAVETRSAEDEQVERWHRREEAPLRREAPRCSPPATCRHSGHQP